MKKIRGKLRDRIKKYIKNRMDISELIRDVDLRNADLSGAIIRELNRPDQDITNCNFANCTIGEEGRVTHLSRAKMNGCSFRRAVFKGKIWMRWVEARNCDFAYAFIPFVEYQHGDFRDSNFCGTMCPMGSRVGRGARFSPDLIKRWGIILTK